MRNNKSNAVCCGIRTLWVSPQRDMNAFAFPKNSSLLPFFNHIYHQMQEIGLLKRLNGQWAPFANQKSCNHVEFEGISIKKTILLFAILLCGVLFAAIILVFEITIVNIFKHRCCPPIRGKSL